jgi:hypothetical protein
MDSAVGKASARHDCKRKERTQISLESVDRWRAREGNKRIQISLKSVDGWRARAGKKRIQISLKSVDGWRARAGKKRIQISLKSVDRWRICCVGKKSTRGTGENTSEMPESRDQLIFGNELGR